MMMNLLDHTAVFFWHDFKLCRVITKSSKITDDTEHVERPALYFPLFYDLTLSHCAQKIHAGSGFKFKKSSALNNLLSVCLKLQKSHLPSYSFHKFIIQLKSITFCEIMDYMIIFFIWTEKS